MSTFEAIILGIIQGLTEFLPVSSSGHLELGQLFFGMNDLHQYIIFDLVCHLGTLLAIFWVLLPEIKSMLTTNRERFLQVCLGTLPLFPLLLIMKPIKSTFDNPQALGFCFLITAALLYAGIRFGKTVSAETVRKNRWRDAVVIGIFQAVAILPGVSRSGSTISAATMLGWGKKEAIAFSFLLAIVAILGGTTIELLQLFFKQEYATLPQLGWQQYTAGFITSFFVGAGSLLLLMKLAAKDCFIYFVWYCVALGLATIFYFNIL